MRFTIASVAMMASVAMAHGHESESVSTAYTTVVSTIIDCGPEVPDCPAHSTVYTTSVVPVTTTDCPETEPTYPAPPPGNGTVTSTWVPVPPPAETSTEAPIPPPATTDYPVPPPATTEAPACPSSSVTAITKSYTTVLTTVEYSTIEVPCPTEQPTVSYTPPVHTPGNNGTTPPVPTGPPASGAASLAGSAVLAAFAGVAAFILV